MTIICSVFNSIQTCCVNIYDELSYGGIYTNSKKYYSQSILMTMWPVIKSIKEDKMTYVKANWSADANKLLQNDDLRFVK